ERRVYNDAKNWPEHAPSTKGTQEESGAPWREYLPPFHFTPSSRWRVAAALLLVIGLALILSAILHTAPKKAQIAQDIPSETIPSENVPERATTPPPVAQGTG